MGLLVMHLRENANATLGFMLGDKRHTSFHIMCQTPRSTSLFLPKATFYFTHKKFTCANVKADEEICGF
ncbi:hypothetical protein HMPREF9069_01541 [Atopobium sp. oral taxon 810 str. F0209]|nr:hypothetical protein HMPREF9069_01541 [Atopobium sp. oral taxon 810 str. F0209]